MFVGVARVVLRIPGARSLKDRRSVVRSFKDRVRTRLKVSVAEVGNSEAWQLATFGLAVVSSDRAICEEVIGQARSIAASLPEAQLTDVRTEVISFGPAGDRLSRGLESMTDEEGFGDDD
jgi:uncharacterized protein YlxP (DUF503 family)